MQKLAIAAVLMLLMTNSLHASEHPWLDARVIDSGFSSSSYDGSRFATVTIELLDPENSNPLARRQVMIVAVKPFMSRSSNVDLAVGTNIKAYLEGQTFIEVQYRDNKGRLKSERHTVVEFIQDGEGRADA